MRTRFISFVATIAVAGLLGAAVAAPAPAGTDKPKRKPKIEILVLGDSNAQGIGRALERNSKVNTVNAASVSCTLSGGTLQGYHGNVIGSGCPEWRTEWPPIVQQNEPDVVLVGTGGWEIVDRWFENPGEGFPTNILDPVYAQRTADAFREAGQLLAVGGAKVAFVNMVYINPLQAEPPPPGVNGIMEIWWEPFGPEQPPPGYQSPLPGQPFVGSKHKTDALNKILADLAKDKAITVYDLNKFAGPKGTYTEKLKGKQVRFTDHAHLNEVGYDMVVDWLVPKLQKQAKKEN